MTHQDLMIILSVLSIILLTVVCLIIYYRYKHKPKKPVFDVDWIMACLKDDNIISVEQVQARVRIDVRDLSVVDLDALKENTNGVFIKGSQIVVTFKDHTKEIVESLRQYIQ